jgi:hypothetical protein
MSMTVAENKSLARDDAFHSGVPGRLIASTDGRNTLQAPMGR